MHAILLDVVVKATLLLGIGGAAAFALGRAPAAIRHLLWTLVAAALLLLPVLEFALPAWEVRAMPSAAALRFVVDGRAPLESAASLPPPPGIPAPVRAGLKSEPAPRVDWILLLWASGASFCLLRLILGIVAMHRIGAAAEVIGEAGGVTIRRGPKATMPMTVGVLHPAILLPRDADSWPEERRRIVIAHELAHIRRRDCLLQVMARVAFSLFWFHPLAWWASRQLVREREHASDDLVLAAGFRASDYAAHLLEVARSFQPAGSAAWAGVAMARHSELEGRLLAILDSNLRRGVVTRPGAFAAVVCTLALVLPLAAMRPAPQVDAPEVLTPELLDSTDYIRFSQVAKAELDRGLLENAQKLYQRSLDLRQKAFGEQSAEYATALVDLARAYQAGGKRTAEAVKLYRQALPIQEARLGPNHPDVATTLYYLGIDAHHSKQTEQAQQLYQRALDIRSRAFGSSDPRVAEVMTSLALLTSDESLYQRSLSVLETGGQKSRELALTLELYARYLQAHDRSAEAEPLLDRANQIRVARVKEIGLRRVQSNHSSPPPQAFKVGAGVAPPKLTSKIEPEYTDTARIEKHQGRVLLYIEVGTDGRAQNIRLMKGIGMGLDENAAEAVSRWTFAPGTKDGTPVTVRATVEVNFRLM